MIDPEKMFSQEIYADQVRNYRKNGEQGIRTSGIEIDEILVKELTLSNADQRNGVTIIARPSNEVLEEIKRLQDHLFKIEPDQYYYPGQDLHMTVLEVSFDKSSAEVKAILDKLKDPLSSIMDDLPGPVIETPVLGFDQKGCALNFVPHDRTLQWLRELLRERLKGVGIQPQSRYLPSSAHVSFFRYLQPIKMDKDQWADYLIKTRSNVNVRWTISDLFITWGANWYGRRHSIHEIGPFRTIPSAS